jgi:hypothetical protein
MRIAVEEQRASLLRRFCHAISLPGVLGLRERRKRGFHIHIHQQVDTAIQLKERGDFGSRNDFFKNGNVFEAKLGDGLIDAQGTVGK